MRVVKGFIGRVGWGWWFLFVLYFTTFIYLFKPSTDKIKQSVTATENINHNNDRIHCPSVPTVTCPPPVEFSQQKEEKLNWLWTKFVYDKDITEKDFMLKVLAPKNRRIKTSTEIYYMNDSLALHGLGSVGNGDITKLRQFRFNSSSYNNMGTLHIGDEVGIHDKDWYRYYDYVIRNYYYPTLKIWKKDLKVRVLGSHSCGSEDMPSYDNPLPPPYPPLGIWWSANGWRSGLGEIPISQLTLPLERSYSVSFVGSLRANRPQMVDAFSKFPRAKLVVEAKFLGSMELFKYGSIVRESAFTLCPNGNSPETIRLADALESGSIPVVQDGAAYLKAFPEKVPFLLVRDWKDAPKLLQSLLDDEAAINDLQRKNIAWWKRYKECIRADLEKIVDRSFDFYHHSSVSPSTFWMEREK